jgi:DNA-binding NarL/FixJ family response regulator
MNILIYDELPLFIHGIRCRWAELAPALHITAAHSEDEVWKGLIKNRADIIILDADYEIEKNSIINAVNITGGSCFRVDELFTAG